MSRPGNRLAGALALVAAGSSLVGCGAVQRGFTPVTTGVERDIILTPQDIASHRTVSCEDTFGPAFRAIGGPVIDSATGHQVLPCFAATTDGQRSPYDGGYGQGYGVGGALSNIHGYSTTTTVKRGKITSYGVTY